MTNDIRIGHMVFRRQVVLIEYAKNRFLKLTDGAATLIRQKLDKGLSLHGVYEAVGGLKFEVNEEGEKVGAW